jgi:predicted acylesterase/phospholipase RssA
LISVLSLSFAKEESYEEYVARTPKFVPDFKTNNLRGRDLSPIPGLKLSFSGNGFLGVYQLGALSRIWERGLVQRNSVMFGSSSGSVLLSNFCGGASFDVSFSLLDWLRFNRFLLGDENSTPKLG